MSPVNCHDARSFLMAYLDSELDAATTLSVREHLRTCGQCAERFEQEEQLERGLAARMREGAMPDDVAQRLEQALLVEAGGRVSGSREAGAAGEGPAPSVPGNGRPRRSANTWRWLATAALLLLTVTLVLTDDGVSREEAPEYVGRLVTAWESDVGRRDSLPVQGPDAVRAMLDGASLSAFEFPGDGRVHDHAVHLLGAREESYHGVRAVNVFYDCCGELTSVFVLPEGAVGFPGGVGALRVPTDLEVEGVQTRTVVRDGLLIGVVSRHASGLAEQWSS